MKPKENQRIALTKRLLQESLLDLMQTKNIQNISVTELCQNSGINRSTFYNHYGCPSDVLAEIENNVVYDLEKLMKEENIGKDLFLKRRVEALCTYIYEHRELFKLLLKNSDTTSGFASLVMNASHVRKSYENTFSYVRDEVDKEMMITFLSNGTYFMIRQWVMEDFPKTPEEIAELVYFIAKHGWEKNDKA